MTTRDATVRALLAPSFVGIILLVAAAPPRRLPLLGLAPAASDSDRASPHVDLVQKDAHFHPIAGARGRVDYVPRGTALAFRLRGTALTPGKRYLIELHVDTTIYAIASHAADSHGGLTLDTTLTRFAEGACVGRNYDAPRPIAGRHTIKFWVKRDGSPRAGTSSASPRGSAGAELPCAGNEDGDYTYILLEQKTAEFTGLP